MKTLPLSEVKMKLSALVDEVGVTDQEVIITKNGRPAAILISNDEYESWKETAAVRAEPGLVEEIKKGVQELKAKKGRLYTLEDLFAER
jgi:antitoxin YefM